MNWKQSTLGEVAEIVGGATPKSTISDYWDGPIPWATPTDLSRLNRKHISKTDRSISDAGLDACSARLLPVGSVLFSSRAPIGLVAINTVPMATNQGFKSFVPGPELNADFLFWWLKANREQLEDLGNGATFKEVSKAVVSRIPFPLPPVDEQIRIAALLDKGDSIRSKRAEALAMADELLKSAFLERFGDPLTNSKDLPVAPIKDFGRVITGNTPSRADPANYGDLIEWIKSDNINTPEHFLTSADECLSERGKSIGRTAPAGSTLVTCIAGSPSVIGNAALADREVAFNQQINAVVPNRHTDPYFLYCQFLIAKKLVQAHSTNSMKGMVSKGKFQEIYFLKPSYDVQRSFGRLVEHVLQSRSRIRDDYLSSDQLFGSLTARAFRGEL